MWHLPNKTKKQTKPRLMDTESRRRCRRGGVGGRNGWGVRGTDFKWPEKQVVGMYLLCGVGNTATNTVSAVRWQVLTRRIRAIVSQRVRMWDRYVAHVELMWYFMSITLPWWKKEAFQGPSFYFPSQVFSIYFQIPIWSHVSPARRIFFNIPHRGAS